jgi:hypothetical protein
MTQTAKHTPGPWYAKQGNDQLVSDDTTVVSLHPGGWHVFSPADTHGDSEADARLIAAAPELLEALELLCGDEPRVPSEIDGDSFCLHCNAHLQVDEPHAPDCPWIKGKAAIAKAHGETPELAA